MVVVWEPILPTDWEPPRSSTLSRISDTRVRQFWDPKHLISAILKSRVTRRPSDRQPPNEGYYWDMALLFAPNTKWENDPRPSFWQGPVYRVIPGLEAALATTEQQTHSRSKN